MGRLFLFLDFFDKKEDDVREKYGSCGCGCLMLLILGVMVFILQVLELFVK